jgi:4-amino-4-deoxy-L-arabinose transferase-like glycosyltransferase
VAGSKTSEKLPVRAYRRESPSGRAVREEAFREPPLRSLSESRALLVLLAIMLLGAVLRFYGLGFQSLWSDELASWDFSNRETISQVIGGVRSADHPPLYFLILHFAQWTFGDSAWALRFPSAFAGWLCIPAIYLLGKRLYSEREEIIAALFLAVFWAPATPRASGSPISSPSGWRQR